MLSTASWTIAKRELKSLFVSPFAYVAVGIIAFLSGFYFLVSMANFDTQLQRLELRAQYEQNPDILNYININSLLVIGVTTFTFMILLFITPVFTMRSFTEERQNSTYELLLTSPIQIWEIVLGKFIAGKIFMFFVVFTHVIFLFVMFYFGNPEVGPIISSYLGLYLAAVLFFAIGLFASALTKSPIVAFIVAFLINISLYLVSMGANLTFGNISEFLQAASLGAHFENFNQGIIQLSSVVFFVSLICLFLAGTHLAVKSVTRT